VAPAWGITGAPGREEPFGRAGPWAREVADLERAYGPGRIAHVSLEEFGRTLTSTEETLERFREGGVRARQLRPRLAAAEATGEVAAYELAYRRFRGFDRPNVLHLFAAFLYRRRFAAAFPEAVQTGPLWPDRPRRASARPGGEGGWVWYASPASAEAIAPEVDAGLRTVDRPPRVVVRTPRPWAARTPGSVLRVTGGPLPAAAWGTRFRRASLRLVTGSRSLLEALAIGGPFLYFNGVLGRGAARRRHRPEKIVAFLEIARRADWPAELLRDLREFSRGQRVAEIVARAARREAGWGRFPRAPPVRGFASGFGDAGEVLVRIARELGAAGGAADEVVARTRARSHR